MRRLFVALSCACSCIASDGSKEEVQRRVDVIAHARALRATSQPQRAEAYLQSQMPHLAEDERARAHGLLGRLLMQRGDLAGADRELAKGLSAGLALKHVPDALADGFALTYLHAEITGNLARAREVLATIAPHAQSRAEDRAALHYHEAFVAHHAGQPRRALLLLDAARAEPVNDLPAALLRAIRALSGAVLAQSGRFVAAHREATEELVLTAQLGDCEEADVLNRRGWYALLASMSALSPAEAPLVALLDLERAVLLAESCPDRRRLAHMLVNLSLAALIEQRDKDLAERALARAEQLDLTSEPVLFGWALEAKGRLALSQGKALEARETFERERAFAQARGIDALAYRALLSIANERVMRGAQAQALEAFQEADALAARLSAEVPISLGHDDSFAQREDAARGAVTVLVALGRVEEAERLARSALARPTQEVSLGARAERLPVAAKAQYERARETARRLKGEFLREGDGDWKLSGAALTAVQQARAQKKRAIEAALDEAHSLLEPRQATRERSDLDPQVLHLTLFPARREEGPLSWLLFARRGGAIHVETVAAPQELLETKLKTRVSALSSAVRRVVLHVHGALQSVDLHSAISGSSHVPAVVYASGLSEAPQAARAAQALLILDPSATLSRGEQEGRGVEESLRAQHLPVVVRRGEEVSAARFLADLTTSTFLHFAGHAQVDAESPLGTAMIVAGRQRVTSLDLLTLSQVPERVVLSACGAGSDADGQLGLARAFLAQGSHEVIAATREVEDREASEVMAALYGELRSGDTLADAFSRATKKLFERRSHADIAAFRVFVR